MSNKSLLASKIIIQEEEPQLQTIPEGATSTIVALGTAERGPLATPTLCLGWADYVATFGSFGLSYTLPLALYGLWKQHPTAAVYVCRTTHYTDPATPGSKTSAAAHVDVDTVAGAVAAKVVGTTVGPWSLEPNETLIVHVDEDGGGPDTATFTAAAAVRAGGAMSLPPDNGDVLILKVDGHPDNQTVTFAGTETTAALASQKINETIRKGRCVINGSFLDLQSDTRGTSSRCEVLAGSTAATHLGATVGSTSGTGNVANIDSVTAAEAETVIEAACTPAVVVTVDGTGHLVLTSATISGASRIMVEVASTADDEFGLDNTLHSGTAGGTVPALTVTGRWDGVYAHALRAHVEAASNGGATYYNLAVKTDAGVVLETWPNVQQFDAAEDDYVETIVNDHSVYIVVDATDLGRPSNGSYTPVGGSDGLTSLGANDFLGSDAGQTGLYAFDSIEDKNILVLPGRTSTSELTGAIAYSEAKTDGHLFVVMDPPAVYTYAQMKTFMDSSGLKNLSESGAMFWPEITVLNPSKVVYGNSDTLTVPPSGWVAGVFSRVDNARPGGVYDQPAGVDYGNIVGCLGFADDNVLREEVRDVIYPERINPITAIKGHGRCIDGVWTLKGGGNFPTIAERRGVSYIEKQVKDGLQWARHRNNDTEMRARAFRTVYNFLLTQLKYGAFRSRVPAEAFFVDFSDALNPPSVVNSFKLVGRIGLATQKPAEYVVLLFAQDTRRLLEEIAG